MARQILDNKSRSDFGQAERPRNNSNVVLKQETYRRIFFSVRENGQKGRKTSKEILKYFTKIFSGLIRISTRLLCMHTI